MSSLIGVDVGGTFTDVVSTEGDQIVVAKVPTEPSSSDRSILAGAARVGVQRARAFNLASTAGLNALITRRVPKVAFLTTMGHRDVLDRGRLVRPLSALMDASWRREFGDVMRPIVPRYLRRVIHERVGADGEVLVRLDENQAREQLRVLARCGVEGVAVCLLHSYANPGHERRLLELIREELGDVACSLSSEISPMAKEYPRASTTVVDVIMRLLYSAYTDRLEAGLAGLDFTGTFSYADCRANLMPARYAMREPYRLVVGGPAAGTVSSRHFGHLIGELDLLCMDIGGTSTDISVVDGGEAWAAMSFELEHDLVVNAPSTDVVTLGAGGGSIVSVSRGGEILVGPESVGARPGPACYGREGVLPTVTDAALLIGILAADGFADGAIQLDPALATTAFEGLACRQPFSERVASAWKLALHNIAEGALRISVRRGIDPRDFAIMAYGAAGPMLLPGLLDLIPVSKVIVPPHPGIFSALGLVSTDQVFSAGRSRYVMLSEAAVPEMNELYTAMEEALLAQIGTDQSVTVRRSFDGRLLGQSTETAGIEVPAGQLDEQSVAELIEQFHVVYQRRNGNRFDQFAVQAVAFRVDVTVATTKVEYPKVALRGPEPLRPQRTMVLRHLFDEQPVAEYARGDLCAEDTLEGPVIIREQTSTTFVPPGRTMVVGSYGELSIS